LINYDGPRRAVAPGIIGGFQAFAAATGPIVGGFLATNLSWRGTFGLEAAVVAVVIVFLPGHRRRIGTK